VNFFFDTSVLVAAAVNSHQHYPRARPALQRVAAGVDSGFMSAHSIAEVFATLTRMPVQPRMHPAEAIRLISENIVRHFSIIPIEPDDYMEALDSVAKSGWIGAKIYDVLLLGCAAKCTPDRIYTFNVADFVRIAPSSIAEIICAP